MAEDSYITLTERELLAALGEELLGSGIGFGPEDEDRFVRFANEWIHSKMDEIRQALCENPKVQAAFARDVQERMSDVAAVMDALSSMKGHPPLMILSFILLRRGYDRVCG